MPSGSWACFWASAPVECHQHRDGSEVLNSHLPVVDLHGNYSTSCPFSIDPDLSSSPFVDSICARKALEEISLSSFDRSQQLLCSLFSLVVGFGFEPKAIPTLLCSLSNLFWFNMSDVKTPRRSLKGATDCTLLVFVLGYYIRHTIQFLFLFLLTARTTKVRAN